MPSVEILILGSEQGYRDRYRDLYLNADHNLFGIPIIFDEKSFEHIFSEQASDGTRQFSKRRAKRIHFMAAILSESLDVEIMFEDCTGNYAVFCADLECVMYLRPIPNKGLQVCTFFDFGKHHSKMYGKQKRKCIEVAPTDISSAIGLPLAG